MLIFAAASAVSGLWPGAPSSSSPSSRWESGARKRITRSPSPRRTGSSAARGSPIMRTTVCLPGDPRGQPLSAWLVLALGPDRPGRGAHRNLMSWFSPVTWFRTISSWPALSWASTNSYKVIARFTMSV